MEQKDIDRINELSRLSRQRELTPKEQAERASLRQAYMAAFRGNLEAQLQNITVVYPDGRREKLKRPESKT